MPIVPNDPDNAKPDPSIGNVRVLPTDHPLIPEMVGYPAHLPIRECSGEIRYTDAPELCEVSPRQYPAHAGFWCTRKARGDGPHASMDYECDDVTPRSVVVWGGE